MKSLYIYIHTKNGKIGVELSQILYFESVNEQFSLVLNDNKRIHLLSKIDDISQVLCYQGFFRINDNYLVNLRKIREVIPGDNVKIIFENEKEIAVTQCHKEVLFEKIEIFSQANLQLFG